MAPFASVKNSMGTGLIRNALKPNQLKMQTD